jgi:hypothetical protein
MKTGFESVSRWVAFLGASTFGILIADGLGTPLKENLDLPFDALGGEEEEEEAPEVVTFYNLNLEAEGFFYVIDKSGSMDGTELPRAKQEVIRNVREFSERVLFGVVFFDKEVETYPVTCQPVRADAGAKQGAIAWVEGAVGGQRGSCCKQGILAGLKMANLAQPRRKVLTYLGDGGGHCPGSRDLMGYYKDALAEIKAANSQSVKINAVGVAVLDEGEVFLRQLTAQNGGTYTRI